MTHTIDTSLWLVAPPTPRPPWHDHTLTRAEYDTLATTGAPTWPPHHRHLSIGWSQGKVGPKPAGSPPPRRL